MVWSEPVADSETERAAKLNFLVEQLKLAVATNIRYSPEMLKWAAAIFYTFPRAYKSMRATQQLTLPHQRYLRKLLCKIGNDGCRMGPTQRAFLIEKFKLLSEDFYTSSDPSYCDIGLIAILNFMFICTKIPCSNVWLGISRVYLNFF